MGRKGGDSVGVGTVREESSIPFLGRKGKKKIHSAFRRMNLCQYEDKEVRMESSKCRLLG